MVLPQISEEKPKLLRARPNIRQPKPHSQRVRDSDGKGYYYIDTDNLPEGVTEAQAIENWFKDPNWYPSTTPEQGA
ncbi:hypothetical protein [Monoglobus pectinilyticus]|uniref:hypothetical protein n=1 Tax=Monoglobus pectinilyticus TaxID=1981510 RepID=UPI00399B98AF